MDLQTYVTTFVAFANGVILPFLLGIAFLLFIFNTIRFFIIGAGNNEAREKARSTALYGLLAFVFILVFWGIVNMLSSSFGLTSDTLTTRPCFDYDPSCGAAPGAATEAPAFTIPGFSSSETSITGFSGTTEINSTAPSMPQQPTFETAPVVPSGTTNADYTSTITPAVDSVVAVTPEVDSSFITDSFDAITQPGVRDEVRIGALRSFNAAGYISDVELTQSVNNINTVRIDAEETPIPLAAVPDNNAYTAILTEYSDNYETAVDIIDTWYGGGIAAEQAINQLFNTEVSLAERQTNAERILAEVRGSQGNEDLQQAVYGALDVEARASDQSQ